MKGLGLLIDMEGLMSKKRPRFVKENINWDEIL